MTPTQVPLSSGPAPASARSKKRRSRPRPPLPAPNWSSCLYLRVASEHVGMFRFVLEAEDNLAYMTVVDRWKAVLRIVYSPHQEKAVREYLETVRALVPFSLVYVPERA